MLQEFVGSGMEVAGIVDVASAQGLGWNTVHRRCEPVLVGNSLGAELSGRSVLIEIMKNWSTHTCECDYIPLFGVFVAGMLSLHAS